MALQTFSVPAVGGLDLVSAPQVLSQKPGAALVLNNYEALAEGGYRRINGMVPYGDIPDVISKEVIRGIAYYKGIVAVIGQYVLHSPDGATWNVVNKKNVSNTSSKGLTALDLIPRMGTGPVEFTVINQGDVDVITITDDMDAPAELKVVGNSYTYTISDNADVVGYRYSTKYQDHVVYAGSRGKPGSIAVSSRFKPLDFTSAGAWVAQVSDEIVGLHTFRDYLYIFCRNSIYRVINLESQKDVAIRPVTTKVGCIDGRSIQEIGGDILFLADDGLRYLGATERIDDVSLNLVSALVRPLINSVAPNQGPVSSVVIPSKAQYRLFFTTTLGKRIGLIGTLGADGQFSWSTTDDMWVDALTMTTEGEGETVYHIGSPTTGNKRVYYHDRGNHFDTSEIKGTWAVPHFNMGDSAVRKTLHFLDAYLEAEDKASIELTIKYDHEDPKVMQPEAFYLEPVVQAARYGEAIYGQATYGAIKFPLDDIFLEGSGKWMQLTFQDNDVDNSPYIIRGYDLQFTPSGRI
ncbi:amidase [Vibrio phage CHOED]|uniref:amidase n=1 Tax=Vibrio phage CHOED TaxID=1458716 RepID=UPI00042F3D29|nr:amidase [Vibrio phage CHOED]AHK11866.1 dimodular nonribosomal peptide synthetase [Vibrio phage CHOED]